METKINTEIRNVLEQFDQKYILEGVINKSKVIQDLDGYNSDLVTALLQNDELKKRFTMKIADATVIKVNDLIEIFELDDYWQDSYTKYTKKIGLTANGKFLDETSEVVLDFPYKDTVLKASMSKEDNGKDDLRPDEPFLNEIIAQDEIDVLLDEKILINAKKYDKDGEHAVTEFSEEDNLILKGNNLLALHTLKERYAGKVKLIYIDPPYNTGNDGFDYNDRFNHAAWLTFMKNRLEIAKDLLSDDGIIFVQCDDNEQAYLKVLLDNVFSKENFMSNIVIKMSEASGVKMTHAKKRLPKLKEYVLSYKKNMDSEINLLKVKKKSWDSEYNSILVGIDKKEFEKLDNIMNKEIRDESDFIFLDNCLSKLEYQGISEYFKNNKIPKNEQEDFRWENAYRIFRTAATSEKFTDKIKKFVEDTKIKSSIFYYITPQNKLYLLKNIANNENKKPRIQILLAKDYLETNPGDFWQDIKTTGLDNEGVISFKNAKKPEEIIKRIINLGTNENDLVLDFFMGSATTQAVAMKMNRRFIGIEQMDYINTVSVPRLQKVIEGEQGGISKDVNWQGGGSFVYAELMEKNTGFIKEIVNATNANELKIIFNRMTETADLDFRTDLAKLENSDLWLEPLDDQKRLLIKIIDKNQLYYNYSEIDDEHVRDLISDNDYAFNQNFYQSEDK